MKLLKQILQIENQYAIILDCIFILYILLDVHTPHWLANFVDTGIGGLVLIIISILIFIGAGPIAGILAFIASYALVMRSSQTTGSSIYKKQSNAEEIKLQNLARYNPEPKSLEVAMVHKMVPRVRSKKHLPPTSYKPVMATLNNVSESPL
tara:strand:- start:1765 stop:2217 length:453 start_codon:yes stop_codon:yes gene_type:complete